MRQTQASFWMQHFCLCSEAAGAEQEQEIPAAPLQEWSGAHIRRNVLPALWIPLVWGLFLFCKGITWWCLCLFVNPAVNLRGIFASSPFQKAPLQSTQEPSAAAVWWGIFLAQKPALPSSCSCCWMFSAGQGGVCGVFIISTNYWTLSQSWWWSRAGSSEQKCNFLCAQAFPAVTATTHLSLLCVKGKFYVFYFPTLTHPYLLCVKDSGWILCTLFSNMDRSMSCSILIFLEFLIPCVPVLVIVLYGCKASQNLPSRFVPGSSNLKTNPGECRRSETNQRLPLNE